MKTTSKLLKAATLSVALIGGTAIATMTISPDTAWAGNGNGKGNGGGNDKSDRGNGGGNDKSDRGNGGGNDKSNRGNGGGKDKSNRGSGGGRNKAERGSSGSSKADRQSSRGGGKTKGKSRSTKSASKRNRKEPATLSDLGRDIKRDVKSLFSRDTQKKRTRTTKRKQASVEPLAASPRPAARDLATRPRPEGKSKKKHVRDPLVAAITDPDGSDKLRNLSASKAASSAFRNASPNSNVGKIATYQIAAEEYYGLRDDLRDARGDLRELDKSYDGRSSEEIEEELEALEPGDPNYENLEMELEDANAYEDARADLTDDIKDLRMETGDALEVAEEAFFDASKGRTVTRDTLGDFHSNLGLPEPKQPGDKDDAEIQPLPEFSGGASKTDLDGADKADASGPVDRDRRKGRSTRDPLVAAITDPDGSGKLRNLNASKAAAAAFANASPNSNVGKIAGYQTAAADYYELRDDLVDARRDLRDFDDSYDGRSSDEILEDIADLDPADEGYKDAKMALEEELGEAEEFEEARDDLQDGVRDLRKESLLASKEAEEAFALASKGEILTKEALAELHSNLGLPAPIH